MDSSMTNGSIKAEPGPSISQHAVKFASPPRLDQVMNDVNGDIRVDNVNDEAAQLLLNVSATPIEGELVLHSPPRKDLPPSTAYLHTPPDDPLPHRESSQPLASVPSFNAGRSVSNPLHNASTPASDAAPSPAQSISGSTSKPRTKRKRNATAGPSRQPPAITPPVDNGERPDHYLGEDNSLIRCICGFDDDDGFTIQCEKCGAWEHGLCFGYMDEDMAPDKFFCELCVPRPVDRTAARELQDQQRMTMPGSTTPGEPPTHGKAGRPRGKKPRADTIVVEMKESKEPSPGAMKPPPAKPKRRPQASAKPRSGKSTAPPADTTPTQATFKEPPIPTPPTGSTGNELDYDFYRMEPWKMDFTPLKRNLFRGNEAKRAMRRLYREWAEEDRDEDFGRKRSMDNPSGLPSPTETGVTRLSPEAILPPPDLSILAPPVPPITLFGDDLDDLSSEYQVKPIRSAPSFLPLSYSEVSSTSGVYSHPSLYGVFADDRINAGSFIGEFRGEVIDCESYRRDPINQYAGLGMPKPFVRSLGPPVDLMIDCRGYGTDLRFIRSSCHPNAVLRPIVLRSPESDVPRLHFGIFASSIDINLDDEITLGWEWDDYHIVHALDSMLLPASSSGGRISAPHVHPSANVRGIAKKFDTVLTTLYGAFSSCACKIAGQCALAQMKYIVDYTDELEARQGQRDPRRSWTADIGELIGAVRGWRRREMEVHGIKQAEPLSELKRRDPVELERARAASRAVANGQHSGTMEQDEEEEQDDEEDRMDLDEVKDEQTQRPETGDHTENSRDPTDLDGEDDQVVVSKPPSRKRRRERPKSPVHAAESDATPPPKTPINNVPTSVAGIRKARATRETIYSDPASSLTSLGASEAKDHTVEHEEQDHGNESDATTMTEARSTSSGDSTDSEDDDQDEAREADEAGRRLLNSRPKMNVARTVQTTKAKPTRRSRVASTASASSMSSVDMPSAVNKAQKKDISKNQAGRPVGPSISEKQRSKATYRELDELDSETGEQNQETEPETEPELAPEPARDPTPPPKEPTPPPVPKAPTPPPPRRVPLAEYLKSRQSNQGVVPSTESPAAEVPPATPAAPVPQSEAQTPAASPPRPQRAVDDGGITGPKHHSPGKEPRADLPSTTPSSARPALPSPAIAKPEVDTSTKAFNINDYLPHRSATATQTPVAESPKPTATTPGLGLQTRDYFPIQKPETNAASPLSVWSVGGPHPPLRKSSSYVPRASSITTPGEPVVNPNSYHGTVSSSYVPRPSPRSEAPPLPPTPSYQPRQSPFPAPPPLPEVNEERQVSIPPPATREPPPHTRPPPTGPKVPPTGPRTSGGSVGSGFPPRDRDWESRESRDSRDRDYERDRDRDWESRDRDRDPVSPRAVFSAGSARGGAPVPVPFHRPRGGGRGGFRGGIGGGRR